MASLGHISLSNFDTLWDEELNPSVVERTLRNLISEAQKLSDSSLYLILLTQIARALALQNKKEEAQALLDAVEKLIKPNQDLVQIRLSMERASLLYQIGLETQNSDNVTSARNLLVQVFEQAIKKGFDYYAINAAQMLARQSSELEEKITWLHNGLKLCEKSTDEKIRNLSASIHNSLGTSYLDIGHYQAALNSFKKVLSIREQEGYLLNIWIAQWSIAHCLRIADKPNEAFAILQNLLKEQLDTTISKQKIPLALFHFSRGMVYEELAKCCEAKAKIYSQLAQKDLSKNPRLTKAIKKKEELQTKFAK